MRLISRLFVVIFMVQLTFAAGCSGSTRVCGNEQELLMFLIDEEPCAGCTLLSFRSPLIAKDAWVRAEPAHTLERCAVARVLASPDSVSLELAPENYRDLVMYRDELLQRSSQPRVLITLAGHDPIAVLDARDLSLVLTLFDFRSAEEVREFVDVLGAGSSAVTWSLEKVVGEESPESQAMAEARNLLRRIDEQDRVLDKAARAIEEGAEKESVREVLDDLREGQVAR